MNRTARIGPAGRSSRTATRSPLATSNTVTAGRRMPGLWSVVSALTMRPSAETRGSQHSFGVVAMTRGAPHGAAGIASSLWPCSSTVEATTSELHRSRPRTT